MIKSGHSINAVIYSAGDHKLVTFAEQELRTTPRLRGGSQSGQPAGQLL
jgi:hypothetical protein